MRLWHKDLIPVLPRQQLLGQWRECCLIAKALQSGTLNHLLVNPIKKYPIKHFAKYCELVKREIEKRGYKTNSKLFLTAEDKNDPISYDGIFSDWHNPRYFQQCYFNLQEKYDRGGIPQDEWEKIENVRRLRLWLQKIKNST